MKSNLSVLMDQHNLRVSQEGQGSRVTVSSLASELGTAYTTIQRMYNDTSKRFDREVVEKICRFFDCGIGDLFVMVED